MGPLDRAGDGGLPILLAPEQSKAQREREGFYRPSGGTAGLVSASTILQMLKEVAARVSSCSTHR